MISSAKKRTVRNGHKSGKTSAVHNHYSCSRVIEMPDGENVLPSKGTPQGGILSPLLANIVLNELDWWIASQWDEMVRHMKHPCKVTYYPNGAEKKCKTKTE